jgi:hypothetical protein
MTHTAWTCDGRPVDAEAIPIQEWEILKQKSKLGDFVMPCCRAPAVLKTSYNGRPFFSHLSDECATAPETVWHSTGKAAVLAALGRLGIQGKDEEPGQSPTGAKWKADILFIVGGRTIAIELQRSYQHIRDFKRRQERYAASNVECYWLARKDVFLTLCGATVRELLKREYGGKFPQGGVGSGMLPELPVAMLESDEQIRVDFGMSKFATVEQWLTGILSGAFQYRSGSWNLG